MLPRIGREGFSGPFLDQILEPGDQAFDLLSIEIVVINVFAIRIEFRFIFLDDRLERFVVLVR